MIQEKTGIEPAYQKYFEKILFFQSHLSLVKSGYPPTEILGNGNKFISQFFSDGEMITIEKSDTPIVDVPIEMPLSGNVNLGNDFIVDNNVMNTGNVNFGNDDNVVHVNVEESSSNIPFLSLDDGVVLKREIPDDNACLFNAIGYCLENKSMDKSQNLRNLIAGFISSDPITYDEGILQKSNSDYCAWIKRQNSWGGSVELMIFADYFKCEIYAFDVTRSRPNLFGEGKNYHQRIYLLYNGIHYDSVVYNLVPDDPTPDFDVTVFNPKDANIEMAVQDLGKKELKKGNFVDEYNYSLICLECRKTFKGNAEAVKHAKISGHQNFDQYK